MVHRTDRNGQHRHVWLCSIPFWKWLTLFDPSDTQVHEGSSEDTGQWGKVFEKCYPPGCHKRVLIDTTTVTSDWPGSRINTGFDKTRKWREFAALRDSEVILSVTKTVISVFFMFLLKPVFSCFDKMVKMVLVWEPILAVLAVLLRINTVFRVFMTNPCFIRKYWYTAGFETRKHGNTPKTPKRVNTDKHRKHRKQLKPLGQSAGH